MRHRVPDRRPVLSHLRPTAPEHRTEYGISSPWRAMGLVTGAAPALAGYFLLFAHFSTSLAAISPLSRDQALGRSSDRVPDRVFHRSRVRGRSALCQLLLQGVQPCRISGDPVVAVGVVTSRHRFVCGWHSSENSVRRTQRSRIDNGAAADLLTLQKSA